MRRTLGVLRGFACFRLIRHILAAQPLRCGRTETSTHIVQFLQVGRLWDQRDMTGVIRTGQYDSYEESWLSSWVQCQVRHQPAVSSSAECSIKRKQK